METFNGSIGNDIWNGGVGDDTAQGGAGDDTLSGGGGNDELAGDTGADTLNGGDGDDMLVSSFARAGQFDYYIYAGLPSESLDTGTEHDILSGGAGDDQFFAGYGDSVDGGANGYAGDYLSISFLGAPAGVSFNLSLGTQTIGGGTITNIEYAGWIQGSDFADTIVANDLSEDGNNPIGEVLGMGGDDHLTAGYYTYDMYGGDGNDVLDGTHGSLLSTLSGGAGNDVLRANFSSQSFGGDGDDTIYGTGASHGEGGNDTIIMQDTYSSGIVTGDAGNDTITASGTGNTISGGSGADTVIGGIANDNLLSGDFDLYDSFLFSRDTGREIDTLAGGAGHDRLNVGYGDNADGGVGNDGLILSLGGATSGVTLNVSALVGGAAIVVGGGTIQGFEELIAFDGSEFGDHLTIGTASYDLIFNAAGGDDFVTTGTSSVRVNGGEGNDTFYSGIAADVFTGGSGIDAIDYRYYKGSVTVDLAAGEGAGGDSFVQIENVTGSNYGDDLSGDDGNNVLSGFGGIDFIYGRGGNDTIYGGAGNDWMYGGAGDDVFYVTETSDKVVENADEGIDIIKSSVSYGTNANVEQLYLTGTADINGTGNALANLLVGNSGSNTLLGNGGDDVLIGGAGLDQLNGGSGADTYYLGSLADRPGAEIADNGLGGIDVLRFASTAAGTLVMDAADSGLEAVDVATGTGATRSFSGTAAINVDASAYGSALILTGNYGANMLTGTAFNDTLNGNAGNDTLFGGVGNDFLNGGAGNDTYYVDSASDLVIEGSGEGNDTVMSTVSLTLGDNFENLTLLGSAALNGNGNMLANSLSGNDASNILCGFDGADRLVGNGGNDVLDGGAGVDRMYGGAGNDVYRVDVSNDVVIEALGEGTDLVQSTASFTLGANVENLTLLGSAAIRGAGNDLANTIIGNESANVLSGLDGNDRLFGLGGLDQLDGGVGNDWIEGGVGRDHLTGGAGADSFVFDNGDFALTTSTGCDVIHDFDHASGDRIWLNRVDANSANGSATDDAFAFIGTAAFHHVAGELRYEVSGGNTYVQGDLDGNGVADFWIRLDGAHDLVAGDFLL